MKLLRRAALAALIVTSVVALWRLAPRAPGSAALGPLTIAAAADLRYALEEVVAGFRDAAGADVSVSYGSSGSFFAQIASGAPFDLFLSADMVYPRELIARGLADPASAFSYGDGRLAVWVPAGSPLELGPAGLGVLADPPVARVAIANPEHAPYGRAAEAALEGAGLLDRVRPKLVLGENVSQALQFVQSGAADAGIVALSLALAPPVRDTGRYWVVPAEAHPPLEQGGVMLRTATDPDLALRFRAFMTSERGRETLARYGFTFSPAALEVPER